MSNCPNCGIRVAKAAIFCRKCGFNLQHSAIEESLADDGEKGFLCPFCGEGNKVHWSVLSKSWVCDNCGKYAATPSGQVNDVRWVTPQIDANVPYGKRRFPFRKVIVVVLILASIGVPIWWLVPTFTLEVVAIPAEGGETTGSGDYHRFTNAQITANASECFEFTGWTESDIEYTSSSSSTVRINDADRTIVANFERYCIPPSEGHLYWEYWDKQPPYRKPFFGFVSLNNSSKSKDPSWSQLRAFLMADDTDQKIYSPLFSCTNFAELLHDNSEEAGIKAAFVTVFFADEEDGHALNAYRTTDKGLVFVDCTGEGFQYLIKDPLGYSRFLPKGSYDKIAYIEPGEEFGVISLDVVNTFSYASYERYMAKWDAYDKGLEQYNEEVMEYNVVFWGCGGVCTSGGACDCRSMDSWYYDLERQRNQLDRQYDELGQYCWEPMGIVDEVEIWW